MGRFQKAPTRSNLMRARETRALAREGHDILDKKREVLTTELMHVAHAAAQKQKEVWAQLEIAYRALAAARLSMGRELLEWTALSVGQSMAVEITPHSIMGVVVPRIEAHGEPNKMPYGLGDTTVELDEAVAQFHLVLAELPELAQLVTTARRLARELQKTQRRVNALEYIFIPRYTETIARIESALEEREREEIFRLKRLKSQAEAELTDLSSS
jgi:V/A-type H+-transporting ATPase subunit D